MEDHIRNIMAFIDANKDAPGHEQAREAAAAIANMVRIVQEAVK